MKVFVVAILALGLCVAAGCSPQPQGAAAAGGGALPPPDPSIEPVEGSSGVSGGELGAASGVGVGSGGPEVELIVPESPTAAAPAAVAIPEASGWTHPEIPLTQQQIDIESCYDHAIAQIARETQIDEDRYQIRNDREDLLNLTALRRRVDYYSEKRRRGALFDSCMQSKGYIRN